MSGHSKWANIKHRKESADRRKGILFNKLSKELMVASRLGGADPATNSRLRIAIEKARAANMSRDSIERALKKGSGEADSASYEEISYEIFAPGGVALIVESLTDNRNRTTPEIKQILNKYNANLGGLNTVRRLFSRSGLIRIKREHLSEEELMEIAIANGAEDIYSDRVLQDCFEITCSADAYPALLDALSSSKIEMEEAAIRYIANKESIIQVTDIELAQKLARLIATLEEHADVQMVHSNLRLAAEIDAALQEQALQ